MRLLKLLEATQEVETKLVDPALMTFPEYEKLVNPDNKSHCSSSYNFNLKDLNSGTYGNTEDYQRVRTFKVKGRDFHLGERKTDRYELKFTKTTPDGDVVRGPDGMAEYWSKEELVQRGVERWAFDFAVIDAQTSMMVGWVTDNEWGCLLVAVVPEYQGFGFGPLLVKTLREIKPGLPSGGLTPGGYGNLIKVHQEFVREYLRTGTYSYLVRKGTISAERAQEIIKDTFPKGIPGQKQDNTNLDSSDPKDWLLYAKDGAFILYDRKLQNVIDQEDLHWSETMLKGYVYVGGFSRKNWYHIKQFGGDTDKIQKLMMSLALEHARREGVKLVIENEDIPYLHQSFQQDQYGPDRVVITSPESAQINYDQLAQVEEAFRKEFDRYGEFATRLQELAHGKYRHEPQEGSDRATA